MARIVPEVAIAARAAAIHLEHILGKLRAVLAPCC